MIAKKEHHGLLHRCFPLRSLYKIYLPHIKPNEHEENKEKAVTSGNTTSMTTNHQVMLLPFVLVAEAVSSIYVNTLVIPLT